MTTHEDIYKANYPCRYYPEASCTFCEEHDRVQFAICLDIASDATMELIETICEWERGNDDETLESVLQRKYVITRV